MKSHGQTQTLATQFAIVNRHCIRADYCDWHLLSARHVRKTGTGQKTGSTNYDDTTAAPTPTAGTKATGARTGAGKLTEPEPEKEPEPAPEQSEEPAGEELGVDAEGGAGSDGFGLIGKKGGRGLLGGSGGSAILWYGGQVKRGLEEELQKSLADSPASKASYSVQLQVWVNADGSVSRAELVNSSGKPEVDKAIRVSLAGIRFTLPKPPPENMPQPLKVRVTSRI